MPIPFFLYNRGRDGYPSIWPSPNSLLVTSSCPWVPGRMHLRTGFDHFRRVRSHSIMRLAQPLDHGLYHISIPVSFCVWFPPRSRELALVIWNRLVVWLSGIASDCFLHGGNVRGHCPMKLADERVNYLTLLRHLETASTCNPRLRGENMVTFFL